MTWITPVPETAADRGFREACRKGRAARGEVANIYQVHSVHPQVMTAHLELYHELMFGRSELTRTERETIALAASATDGCRC